MSNLGSLNSSPQFFAWIQSLGGISEEALSTQDGVVITEGSDSVVTASQKNLDEDIATLGLPLPLPTQIAFNQALGAQASSFAKGLGIPDITSMAEQKVVLAMLDAWSEAEAKHAVEVRNNIKVADEKSDQLRQEEAARRVLQEYMKALEVSAQPIPQIVLSVLATSVVLSARAAASIQAVTGVGSVSQTVLQALSPYLSTNTALASELSVLSNGILATTIAWATPVAFTLALQAKGLLTSESEQQFSKDAARAFCITLAQFITSPAIDDLFLSRFARAEAEGKIGKGMSEQLFAAFKISLMMNALALLYRSDHGGITAEELAAHFDGTLQLDDNVQALLVQLILEQHEKLSPQDQKEFLHHVLTAYSSLDSTNSTMSLIDPLRAFLSIANPHFPESQLPLGRA